MIEEVDVGLDGFDPVQRVLAMPPVRGTRWDTYAEYVALDAPLIAPRPAALDAVQADTAPLAGSAALQLSRLRGETLDRLAEAGPGQGKVVLRGYAIGAG